MFVEIMLPVNFSSSNFASILVSIHVPIVGVQKL